MSRAAILLLIAALAAGPRLARAGDDGEQKKQEKAWKKLEDEQKKKAEPKKNPEETPGEDANPLPKILDLMKEVESRLNDTDLEVSDDQKKIVEAMKFEDKTKAALDDLIRKIEDGT